MPATIFTIGHSDRELDEFVDLLLQHGITQVIDVRKLAGSNKFPHFNADPLQASLLAKGIELHRESALTGRRPVSKTIAFEVNAWWSNRSFHNYADHALSTEFNQGLERVCALAAAQKVALMCAEAVWWRCHRRIIADHLLARGNEVFHIIDQHPVKPAQFSAGAAVDGNLQVTYPNDSARAS